MNKIFLTLIFFIIGFSLAAQKINTPYDFPIKPGTEEWKQLKSGEEMVRVCKIPDSILTSLTTEALAKTCLSYPLLNEVFYANNLQTGIEKVIKKLQWFVRAFKKKGCRTSVV